MLSDSNPPAFALESYVRHKKTQGIYKIKITPDKGRLESTGEPAYSYEGTDGLIWHRAQTLMEDGRFEPYLEPVTAIHQ